jgi:hypothetical protein
MNSQYFDVKDVSTPTKFSELMKKINSRNATYNTKNIYGDDWLDIAMKNCNYKKNYLLISASIHF